MSNPFNDAGIRRIVFFFPYHGVGGVPVLFLRIATALLELYPELHISLIDYPDGYMARNRADQRLELLPYTKGNTVRIPDDAVFVLQSMPLWRLPREISFGEGTRLLLWHLHPFNISPGVHWFNRDWDGFSLNLILRKMFFAGQRRQFRRFVEECHSRRGLIFMDRSTLDGLRLTTAARIDDPVFVPVPCGAPLFGPSERTPSADPLRCAWVGRLEDFKIPILAYTLERTAAYASARNRQVIFHVVGSGQQEGEIAALGQRLKSSGCSVVCHGSMTTEQLDVFLDTDVDLLFAMGTAALEGAKLGIPVVLLDFSYNTLRGDYEYRFLFDTVEYSLGSLITDVHYRLGNTSLESMLDELDCHYEELSEKTISYFRDNHSLDGVVSRFVAAACDSRLDYGTVTRLGLAGHDMVMRIVYPLKRMLSGFDYHFPFE